MVRPAGWVAVVVVVVVVVVGASATGCTPDFENPTTVKDLRMLAVPADTPEVLVDVGPLATISTLPRPEELPALLAEAAMRLPETFEPVVLRPLLIDPRGGGRELVLHAVLCADTGMGRDRGRDEGPGGVRDTSGRGACGTPAPLAEERAVAAADGTVPWTVTFIPTRPMLAAALAGDAFGAVFGLPLSIQLTAEAADGSERVAARKRVVFMPRLADEQLPNRNPTIPRLTYRLHESEGPRIDFDLADPLTAPPEVPLGGAIWLEPEKGEMEPYAARTYHRDSGELRTDSAVEALRYAYFTTAGTFAPGTTTTEPPPILDRPQLDLASKYQAPAVLEPGQSDLVWVWVVVRDERAGTSFVKVALRLVP